jgi:chorismate dehydratase
VSYLNTAPLVWGMLHGEQRNLFELSFAIPAECADRLADARADIGLVPAVELGRQTLQVIPGAGIACDGPVRSILLISRVPFAQIRTLAADASSRTSVALAQIVLQRKYGVEPLVLARRPDVAAMLEECDAALIIGDPALRLDPASIPFHSLDLGEEWTAMTGLPMVFAVWASRAGLPVEDPRPFLESLRYGEERIDDIVRERHAGVGVSAELAREYLTRRIVFRLGEREYQGLSLFLKYAAELRNRIELRSASV